MRLEATAEGYEALLYLERRVGEGAKTYSPFSARTEAAPCYRPESSEEGFDLVAVNAPKENVSIFAADPSPALLNSYVRPQGIRFVIHPQTWAAAGIERLDEIRALPREAPIAAAPTASTRTVFAHQPGPNVPPHFIKLHFPWRVSRFNRRLRLKNIRNSVAVTKDMAHVHFDKFAYLPEVLGFAFGADDDAWGFLVREAVPCPAADGRFLIPCFALYAGDSKRPDDVPLIVQMIERLKADPAAFVTDEIFVPVVECWCKLARERGVLLESHAQNTLLEIDRDFRPRRVVHRDFDVWIDWEARRRAGLDEAPFGGAADAASLEQRYSLVYDRFMGHAFFDYLLAALKRFYAMDEERVRARVREAFHRSFPDANRFFPARTMYYFTNDPPPGREFALEDMRQAPVWR